MGAQAVPKEVLEQQVLAWSFISELWRGLGMVKGAFF
jgi:hypothetical protein